MADYINDPSYWIEGGKSHFNVSEINYYDIAAVQQCSRWNQIDYGNYTFFIAMIILNTLLLGLSRRYPKLLNQKIKKNEFPFYIFLKRYVNDDYLDGYNNKRHPILKKVFNGLILFLEKTGLHFQDEREFNLLQSASKVCELALYFRIIQFYLMLKFTYHLI